MSQVNVSIHIDEMYPFFDYRVTDNPVYGGRVVSVSNKSAERWSRVMREFEEVQTEMREILGEP